MKHCLLGMLYFHLDVCYPDISLSSWPPPGSVSPAAQLLTQVSPLISLSLVFASNMSPSVVGSSLTPFFISPFPPHVHQHHSVVILSFLTVPLTFKECFLCLQFFSPILSYLFHTYHIFWFIQPTFIKPVFFVWCQVNKDEKLIDHHLKRLRLEWSRDQGQWNAVGKSAVKGSWFQAWLWPSPAMWLCASEVFLACKMGIMIVTTS